MTNHEKVVNRAARAVDEACARHARVPRDVTALDIANTCFVLTRCALGFMESPNRRTAHNLLRAVAVHAVHAQVVDKSTQVADMLVRNVGERQHTPISHAALVGCIGNVARTAFESDDQERERERVFAVLLYAAATIYEDCVSVEHTELEGLIDTVVLAGMADDEREAREVLVRAGRAITTHGGPQAWPS